VGADAGTITRSGLGKAIAKRDYLQQSNPKATASQLTIASGSQDKTIKIWQFE
jgi:hypothetical protein